MLELLNIFKRIDSAGGTPPPPMIFLDFMTLNHTFTLFRKELFSDIRIPFASVMAAQGYQHAHQLGGSVLQRLRQASRL